MANITIDNGALTQFIVSSKELTGNIHVQGVELVTATEGGGRADLAKAEDVAHASGDMGIQMLAVRKDTASAVAGADGRYIPLIVDASGRLHVNVGSMPAAARTTDSLSVAMATDVFMDDLTVRTPGRAAINASASGPNTLLAAQGAGNAIRVHGMFMMAASAVTATIESGAGGVDLSGPLPLAANVGFVADISPVPWLVTADDALLNLNLSTNVQVSGFFVYSVA